MLRQMSQLQQVHHLHQENQSEVHEVWPHRGWPMRSVLQWLAITGLRYESCGFVCMWSAYLLEPCIIIIHSSIQFFTGEFVFFPLTFLLSGIASLISVTIRFNFFQWPWFSIIFHSCMGLLVFPNGRQWSVVLDSEKSKSFIWCSITVIIPFMIIHTERFPFFLDCRHHLENEPNKILLHTSFIFLPTLLICHEISIQQCFSFWKWLVFNPCFC